MKLSLVTAFCLLLILFSNPQLNAQRKGGPRQGDSTIGNNGNITISGSVIDKESSNPLEFATISVYSLVDSTLVGGGITDTEGKFQITISSPKAYAVIEYISYNSITQLSLIHI